MIPHGVGTIREINRSAWHEFISPADAEQLAAVERRTGVAVHLVEGDIGVEGDVTADNPFGLYSVRGAETESGIWVTRGDRDASPGQIGRHEEFHSLCRKDAGLLDKALSAIKAEISEEQLRDMVDQYMKGLRGIYGDMPDDQLRALAEEDLCADAYSGINFEGIGADAFSDQVRNAAQAYAPSEAAQSTPGDVKFSPQNRTNAQESPSNFLDSVLNSNKQPAADYSFGQAPKKDIPAGDLVLSKPGSPERQYQDVLASFRIPSFVVKAGAWEQFHRKDYVFAFTNRGQVYIREGVSFDDARLAAAHEPVHVMRQAGFKPYMELLDELPGWLDFGNKGCQDAFKGVAAHADLEDKDGRYYYQGTEIGEQEYLLNLYDEFAATAFGHIGSGVNFGPENRQIMESWFVSRAAFEKFAERMEKTVLAFMADRGANNTEREVTGNGVEATGDRGRDRRGEMETARSIEQAFLDPSGVGIHRSPERRVERGQGRLQGETGEPMETPWLLRDGADGGLRPGLPGGTGGETGGVGKVGGTGEISGAGDRGRDTSGEMEIVQSIARAFPDPGGARLFRTPERRVERGQGRLQGETGDQIETLWLLRPGGTGGETGETGGAGEAAGAGEISGTGDRERDRRGEMETLQLLAQAFHDPGGEGLFKSPERRVERGQGRLQGETGEQIEPLWILRDGADGGLRSGLPGGTGGETGGAGEAAGEDVSASGYSGGERGAETRREEGSEADAFREETGTAAPGGGHHLYGGDAGGRSSLADADTAEQIRPEAEVRGGTEENQRLISQRLSAVEDQVGASLAEMGVDGGSKRKTVRLMPDGSLDYELRDVMDVFRGLGIGKTYMMAGEMTVDRGAGPVNVLDVVNRTKGELILRADGTGASATEVGLQSAAHLTADSPVVKSFMDSVKNHRPPSIWKRMFDIYREVWAPLTDDYAGLTEAETELFVWGKILGDACAGVDNYGVGAGELRSEAAAALAGDDGPQLGREAPAPGEGGPAAWTPETTGPPVRFSVSDTDGPGETWEQERSKAPPDNMTVSTEETAPENGAASSEKTMTARDALAIIKSLDAQGERWIQLDADPNWEESKRISLEGVEVLDGDKITKVRNRLRPNTIYKAGEHNYYIETDDLGRVKCVYAGELHMKTHKNRKRASSNETAGKLAKDHAGHLIADLFGGSNKLVNMVSMDGRLNQLEYAKMERVWRKALESGGMVRLSIEVIYEGANMRPSGFDVTYTVTDADGIQTVSRVVFSNAATAPPA